MKDISNNYSNIFKQYVEDASSLWSFRSIAVNQPHCTLQDIDRLDGRIDAQIDGLMSAPEESWLICEAALALLQPGEVFTASALAFRSLDVRKIQRVVEVGLSDDYLCKGLISAMAWLPGRLVHSWIKKFLTSKDLAHKYLAIAVCSARRENPREFLANILQREDCLAYTKLYARLLRLIGELKRFDLVHALHVAMLSDDDDVVFWAKWSAVMLGNKSVAIDLQRFVLKNNQHQLRAIELCFRVLPLETARTWISLLAKDPANIRMVIKATASLGDPHAINWLVVQMRTPSLSRLAGEAFTVITGIDLQENKLALEELPNLDEILPENGENDFLECSGDEYLAFPDVNKVAAVWQKYQHRFISSRRYFLGHEITSVENINTSLSRIFLNATQRHRRMAALELAILDPSQFLMNHEAKEPNELA